MQLFRSIVRRWNPQSTYSLLSAFGGPVTGSHVTDSGIWVPATRKDKNMILYPGADILTALLSGLPEYRISTMYLEFVKSATSFTPPSVTRASANYYPTLLGNGAADSDILRVPLNVSPEISTSAVGTYTGNTTTFFAQTSGTTGLRQQISGNGLTFATGDKIVGAALVSTPGNTYESDVIFARFYFTSGNQIQKLASQQVGITWPVRFS